MDAPVDPWLRERGLRLRAEREAEREAIVCEAEGIARRAFAGCDACDWPCSGLDGGDTWLCNKLAFAEENALRRARGR